jgi:hypothetical protein
MPDATCLNVLNHFNFWSAVPLDGSATYPEIAKHVNLPLDVTFRILQHAVTLRIFAETVPGSPTSSIVHTSRSAAVLKSEGIQALLSTVLDDAGAPMMVLHNALERYSAGKQNLTTDMEQTAFALFHQDETFGSYTNSWDFIENDGEGKKKGWRQRNFIKFMDHIKEIFQFEQIMINAYDWTAAGDVMVVDVSSLC